MHLFLPISKVTGRVYASPTEELVPLWTERKNQRSVIAPVLSKVDELLSSFESFNFGFLRRTANSVAQEYARYARELVIYADWFEFFPMFLSHRLTASRLIVRTWL
jgi:hypothetical protein